MTLLILIVLFLKLPDFIYLFQIKEYRFDRFFNFIKEEGFWRIFYRRMIRLPARKLRNVGILIASSVVVMLILINIFYLPFIYQAIIFLISPIIAFLICSLMIFLTNIAAYFYREFIILKAGKLVKSSKVIFIAITGSYGKTSVKEFLYQILSAKYRVAKTEANMNTDIGIALSILKNLKKDTQFFIAELGAYKIGEITKACKIMNLKYGILTGIGNQHLGLFGTKENLIKAKAELFQALPNNGIAYINKDAIKDNQLLSYISCQKKLYSITDLTDIYAQDISYINNQLQAKIYYQQGSLEIKTKLIGLHNLLNLLPCIALALDLKLSKKDAVEAIRKIKNISARLSIEKGINSSTILNDSYNSNVNGFLAAIDAAQSLNNKKKIIVSRGIIELGKEKERSYKKIIERLNSSDSTLLTTDLLFKKYDEQNKVTVFDNESNLWQYLQTIINKNSFIVIEGKFPLWFNELLMPKQ